MKFSTVIRRTPYQSFAAFLVLFFTLLLTSFLCLAAFFTQGLLSYVETLPQIKVFFQVKAADGDINALRTELVNSGKAQTVQYVTHDQALEIFKKSVQDEKDKDTLLQLISAENLPASLEMNANSPQELNQLVDFLNKYQLQHPDIIDQVQVPRNIVNQLNRLTTVLRLVGVTSLLYLVTMTIVVLFTITHFKIALKRDEIELLRLLGATNKFIRRPFLQEARAFGAVAGFVTFALSSFVVFLAQGPLGTFFGQMTLKVGALPVWPLNPAMLGVLLFVLLVFGVGISLTAAFAATQKFIR